MTRKRKFGRYRRFSPQKGTKSRKLLLLALRPEGVTIEDAAAFGVTERCFQHIKVRLKREYGYQFKTVFRGKGAATHHLTGRFYDKYCKSKSFEITNETIAQAQSDKKLTREDAKKVKFLREIEYIKD